MAPCCRCPWIQGTCPWGLRNPCREVGILLALLRFPFCVSGVSGVTFVVLGVLGNPENRHIWLAQFQEQWMSGRSPASAGQWSTLPCGLTHTVTHSNHDPKLDTFHADPLGHLCPLLRENPPSLSDSVSPQSRTC